MTAPSLDPAPALGGYGFLEAYPDAIAIHRGGIVLYINRAGLALMEADGAAQLIGRNVLEFVHPDARAIVLDRLKQTTSGQAAGLLAERFVTLTGRPLDVEVVALPINIDGGPATQLIVRDVTELRRVERENERLARAVAEAMAGSRFTEEALELAESAAGLGVWDWDIASGGLRWTKGLEPLHGMEPGTFRGTFEHFLEAVIEEDRPALLSAIEAVMAGDGGDAFEARMRVRHADELRWILGKGRLFRDADGKPQRLVGIGLDVTGQTATELALAEQEQLLRLVTGLLPANVAYFDTEERYRFVNDTYRTWFGVEPGSVTGKTAAEFMGRRAYEMCAPSLRRALAGEACELEMDILNPAGGRRYLHARYVPDIAADGSVRGCVALINDVTGVREATARLESALAARDDFIGFTTHELKTPLTVILGFADVLARRSEELGTNTVREVAELLHQEARRLDEIVENMLVLARADRAASDEPVLLHRSLARVLNSRRWRNHRQEHRFDVSGHPGLVLSPPGWIEQVLENFVSNAEKYGDEDAPIEVEVAAEPAAVCVRVLDRGRGVSEEQAAQLFEPFFRANPNEPGVPGIGLGLTVCRKLILRLGGEIWLRPRAGGGTEAGFRLPVAHLAVGEGD